MANPFQPRTRFDQEKLDELSASISQLGIIQPITLRKVRQNKYQIISGERRFRASQLAGLTEVPAYIRVANDQTMLEMALVENIQRDNLDAIEVAISYQRLTLNYGGSSASTALTTVSRQRQGSVDGANVVYYYVDKTETDDRPYNPSSTYTAVVGASILNLMSPSVIFLVIEVSDGAADTYSVNFGSWETWGFPGASIVDGTFLWDVDPASPDETFRYWAIGFTPSNPLDLSNDSYFAFDYKNLASASTIGFYVASSTDGEVEFYLSDLGVEVIEGNPNFNTFEIEDLGAKILEVDPSFDLANIIEFGFNTEGGLPVSFDNLKIGKN